MAGEERIMVSVRLRPVSAREAEHGDSPADWLCVDPTTLVYGGTFPERPNAPTTYTYDRVFSPESDTRKVYEEGARKVALSVLKGINSSIFAYGQTSSGKTYTMAGVTEYSMSEIYAYVEKHTEREFILSFSAMEIYNEAVRDLLSDDPTPLRLLDDPEKGTIIEYLSEVTLTDKEHLSELLSLCQAQRRIGETSLNETSSRSHQILRLTVESSAKKSLGRGNSSTLLACVDFVDLAGSERAAQTASSGTRLLEGSHINKSLLTLGKVIRQLSTGSGGHIPYRDSKLTRILQCSLGGSARTAVICTMSPALSQIEQSRKTLLFANCAKNVVTNAQVNVVSPDKTPVKNLQKELTKLENEVGLPGSASGSIHANALREKDELIKKLQKQLKELMEEKDTVQSELEGLRKVASNGHINKPAAKRWDAHSRSSAMSEDGLSSCDTNDLSSSHPHSNHGVDSMDECETASEVSEGFGRRRSPESIHALKSLFEADARKSETPKKDRRTVQPTQTHTNRVKHGEGVRNGISSVNKVQAHQAKKNSASPPRENQSITEDFAAARNGKDSPLNNIRFNSQWPIDFEKRKREIIKLWHECHVPIVHRTFFFLLFNGDQTDHFYMEVEHRRLSFIKNSSADDGAPGAPIASSLRKLRHERDMIYKRMLRKMTNPADNESLYDKWGIDLNSKQRRLQLSRRIWTETHMGHVRDSAELVAKLVENQEEGQAIKEMFGLSITSNPLNRRRSFNCVAPGF